MSVAHFSDRVDAALDLPQIKALDLGAFKASDLSNIILQRSEVLYDLPKAGAVIRAWENGDAGPMQTEIARLGGEIARRAAAVIWLEFDAMRPLLETCAPTRIADIGCGYAFFDLFAARAFGAKVLLIDLESNERRHFGFQAEGAAYSSLAVARTCLEANGIAAEDITVLNPESEDVLSSGASDLVVSFLSCGFHYPLTPYLPFLDHCLSPGGHAIFDLRAAKADGMQAELEALGAVRVLDGPPKTRRVLLKRNAGDN